MRAKVRSVGISRPPSYKTRLIGRERELALLEDELLEDRQLVTLIGPAGVGKTRLAVAFAELIADAFVRENQQGYYYCPLSQVRDSASLDEQLLRSVTGARTNQAAEKNVLDALVQAGHCLIVIDEAEHVVEQLAAKLANWLPSIPEARFLVTSREPLRIGQERCIEVKPLSTNPDLSSDELAPSCEFFYNVAERQGYERGQLPLDDVQSIASDLNGLPLAIELAVGQLKVLGTSDIRRRLVGPVAARGIGARRGAGRHDSMLKAVESSWSLLNEQERAVLSQAAQFGAPFRLRGLRECCELAGLTEPTPVDCFSALVRQSLITRLETEQDPQHAEYTIYTPIRTAVLSLQTVSEPAQVHLRWVRARLEDFRENSEARKASVAESLLAECRVAMERLTADEPEGALAAELAVAMSEAFEAIGYANARRMLLREALVHVAANEHPDARVRALLHCAICETMCGDIERAKEQLGEAQQLLEGRATAEEVALLGEVAKLGIQVYSGKYEQCLETVAHVLDRSPQASSASFHAYSAAALALMYQGKHVEAERCLRDALAQAQLAGIRWQQARVLTMLCAACSQQGRLEESLELSEQAIAACESVNDDFRLAWVYGLRATIELERVSASATRWAARALKLHRRHLDARGLGNAKTLLALCLLAEGKVGDSIALLRSAEQQLHAAPIDRRTALAVLAAVQHIAGDVTGAEASLSAARAIAGSENDASGVVQVADTIFKGQKDYNPGQSTVARCLVVAATEAQDKDVAAAGAAVVVDREGRWFRNSQREITDLRQRDAARYLVAALCRAYEHDASLSRLELIAIGWPAEELDPKRANNRLKVMLHSLRSSGLADVLVSRADGYRFEGALELVDQEEPPPH